MKTKSKAQFAVSENAAVPPNVNWQDYDYVDFGCSKGGSLQFGKHRFGGVRGIGIDLSERKVNETRAVGLDAVVADALRLEVVPPVRFVLMMDFLEHLPNLEAVEQAIEAGARSATDFLFIRHPSFEGEGYLRSLGVQQYWWSWRGHKAHVRVSDYCQIFDRLGLRNSFIRYRETVLDSTHPSVIPLSAGPDSGDYDLLMHGEKPFVKFDQPVWRAQDIFVALRPLDPKLWQQITSVV